MNENSSKQVLLSVLGIAVLVVAVVGVSFAFFTYSKNGTSNNTLTTGSIFFNFIEGNAINLTNQFPKDNTAGMALTTAQNGALEFSVVGYDTSGKGIDYTITAIEGNAETGKTRFKDSEIKLYLTGASATTNNYSTPAVVGAAGSLANGVTLAKGKITANAQATQQEDEYVLRMWIASDVVSLDEQETSNDGDSVYNSEEFGNMYYSLKYSDK